MVIVDLEDDRFVFGFNTKQEWTMIQEGQWLYNKQFLLVMEDTDDVTHPTKVPLSF